MSKGSPHGFAEEMKHGSKHTADLDVGEEGRWGYGGALQVCLTPIELPVASPR